MNKIKQQYFYVIKKCIYIFQNLIQFKIEKIHIYHKYLQLRIIKLLIKINHNKLIYKKLDKIFKRPHKINNDSEIIDGYLNEKKYARIKCHEIKKDLLLKENELFKKRIYNTKPVIDNKAFDNEFKKYRKISGYLRKIHPCESSNNIYLNRKESQIIREYEKEKMDYYKEKEAKEKSFSTNKYAFLSINSSRVNSNMNYSREKNKKKDVPFKINKKILRKIKNV